jgi:2,4-dienoyl-CoA reductase-like NADH-dependent reductase (Old Yellow Enzyme family)
MISEKYILKNKTIPNRVVFQPMEGFDCMPDGSPGELTVEKYRREARSGAGIIWFEANAVCPEGRTNLRQMMLTEENVHLFSNIINEIKEIAEKENRIPPITILQLTHSGRQSITPMIAYRNKVYEEKRPQSDENIVNDAYLDSLPELYVKSALLAKKAGFDGVDVKACHGYLLAELLSAFNREGKYGGSLENRARLYLNCIKAVKEALPEDFLVTSRLGISDMVPKPYGFGTDESGEIDFTEPDLIVGMAVKAGISLLNVTVGNPYYNPHINRPFRKGGYVPPETPEKGLERFVIVERHLKEKFPELPLVGSGLSYYRNNLLEGSETLLKDGVCDFVGYGRVSLAYPEFYRDYLEGRFDARKCCVTCSKCTELMRGGAPSGCAVFNDTYKKIYEEKILCRK